MVDAKGRKNMKTCHKCTVSPITIRMRIAGREVVFQRCSTCEVNTWHDDLGDLTLTRVLEMARTR
jgi:hypothetical protein